MRWRDLIEAPGETIVAPWVGGNDVRLRSRRWALKHDRPRDPGWYRFNVTAREVRGFTPCEADQDSVRDVVSGYLVGDRLVTADAAVVDVTRAPRVHLLVDDADRFTPIAAGVVWDNGPLIYLRPIFPSGPEDDVRRAFEDGAASIAGIKGVCPALDAAFRLERFVAAETARLRAEAERRRREEEERLAREARRAELTRQLGDGQTRRELAKVDFATAARAALAVGDAEYITHRKLSPREYEIKYRIPRLNRRLACVVDERLQIIDSGICLTAHYEDDGIDQDGFEGGTKGDTWLTLESLPSVVRQAHDAGRLVVYRHG